MKRRSYKIIIATKQAFCIVKESGEKSSMAQVTQIQHGRTIYVTSRTSLTSIDTYTCSPGSGLWVCELMWNNRDLGFAGETPGVGD